MKTVTSKSPVPFFLNSLLLLPIFVYILALGYCSVNSLLLIYSSADALFSLPVANKTSKSSHFISPFCALYTYPL